MRRALAGILAFALAGAALAQQVPKLLVVQVMAPVEEGRDFNVAIRQHFAMEFDNDGRVQPIVWAMTDPIFRAAVEQQTIRYEDAPKLDDIFAAAGKLQCTYILVVHGLRHGTSIVADAKLYDNRREIWKHNGRLAVTTNQQAAFDDAANSIARTWVLLMAQTPLKHLTPKRIRPTPEPDPGAIKPITADPPPPPRVDNAALKTERDRLVKAKEWGRALQLVRDAIDAEPVDPERRSMLIELLLQMGRGKEAGEEARRAAGLFPDRAEFWVLSARSALDAGDHVGAIRELNEAVVRRADSPQVRALLGEAQLLAGRYEFAVEHFDAALKTDKSARTLLLRGVAHWLRGDAEASDRDLAAAKDGLAQWTETERRDADAMAFQLLAAGAESLVSEVRSFMLVARRSPKDPTTLANHRQLAERTERWVRVAATLENASSNPQSQKGLGLAIQLLRQSVAEIGFHLQAPDEDVLADATISLGEAISALEHARKARSNGN